MRFLSKCTGDLRGGDMRRVLLILAMFLCGTVYAFAGPTEWEFLNWNGGDWTNGYPYYISQVDGPNSQIYAVMCDDYAHGRSARRCLGCQHNQPGHPEHHANPVQHAYRPERSLRFRAV